MVSEQWSLAYGWLPRGKDTKCQVKSYKSWSSNLNHRRKKVTTGWQPIIQHLRLTLLPKSQSYRNIWRTWWVGYEPKPTIKSWSFRVEACIDKPFYDDSLTSRYWMHSWINLTPILNSMVTIVKIKSRLFNSSWRVMHLLSGTHTFKYLWHWRSNTGTIQKASSLRILPDGVY